MLARVSIVLFFLGVAIAVCSCAYSQLDTDSETGSYSTATVLIGLIGWFLIAVGIALPLAGVEINEVQEQPVGLVWLRALAGLVAFGLGTGVLALTAVLLTAE